MWKNKSLKKEAKNGLKKNYWKIVVVCLLIAFLSGTAIVTFNFNIEDINIIKEIPNASILEKYLNFFMDAENTVKNTIANSATSGLIYNLFNNITKSDSVFFGIMNSVNQFVFNNRISAGILILVGLLIELLYIIFVRNVLEIGEARFLLESKNYSGTEVNRLLFIYRIKRVKNVAKVMFFRSLYSILWSFTIIGGVIKFYSYRMIPFILAENPDITKKEAFALSRQMMKGNKFKAFILDLSFIHWDILSLFTFGILNILFVNPYKKMTFANLYIELREESITNKIEYSEKLNDIYLYTPCEESTELSSDVYPVELFGIKEVVKDNKNIYYNRKYSIQSIILMFFTFSAIGWVWEIFLNVLNFGTIVNKGVLLGPWLPIYGSGGVLMLVLLKKWRNKPVLTFFLCMAVATIIEYATGYYLEVFKGLKWWDYTGYFLNISGYVCLENAIAFGLAGILSIYFIAPNLDDLYEKISIKKQTIICIILVTFFALDFIHSIDNPNTGEWITMPAETSNQVSLE